MRLAVLMLSMTACVADEVETPPAVVQNIQYDTHVSNVTNVTNVTKVPSPSELAPSPTLTPPPPPRTAAQGVEVLPPPHATTPLTRDVAPVGIAACDDYLARLETCSTRMLSRSSRVSSEAMPRLTGAFDMMRRSWRRAATIPSSRWQLAETCADARRYYDSSIGTSCDD